MAYYRIFENDVEVNTIVADEDFCKTYCEENGYTYEHYVIPEPENESEPTAEERIAALEAQLAELLTMKK